jgi:hypothetical protein
MEEEDEDEYTADSTYKAHVTLTISYTYTQPANPRRKRRGR